MIRFESNRFAVIVSVLGFFGFLQMIYDGKITSAVEQSLRGTKDMEQTIPLHEAEAEITSLREKLDDYQQQLQALKEKSRTTEPAVPSAFDPTNICSVFPASSGTSGASRLWEENLTKIWEATLSKDWTDTPSATDALAALQSILEDTLSPARMRRSIRHLPTFSHHVLRRVMGIIEKRLQDPESNPPLRIAVFGGSVTLGRGCDKTNLRKMQNKECAWPKRFERLINQFFGREIIQVFNLAIGGTSTISATSRVKYWMYGDPELDKLGPDVIINSYSTNDSIVPWGTPPEADLVKIVGDNVRDRLEPFIRETLQSKGCDLPPLIVHVDDSLGPHQPTVLGEMSYVSEMTRLAKWYDTVAISYAEVVRDLVYQDRSANIFADPKDAHFHDEAHQTVAWTVGFAALQLVINYCDDEHSAQMKESFEKPKQAKEGHVLTKEEMKADKLFLPPPLTRDLLLEETTSEFEAALELSHSTYIDKGCGTRDESSTKATGNVDRNPCEVAWISTPGLTKASEIRTFMSTYQTQIDGWEVETNKKEGWSNKVGWVAVKEDATFRLRFSRVAKDIKTVTIYFMRSYGEKWHKSKARITVYHVNSNSEQAVAETEVSGVWEDDDYKYSLTQLETMHLSETVAKGETIDIKVDLISGSTFKIMGLMLCNK